MHLDTSSNIIYYAAAMKTLLCFWDKAQMRWYVSTSFLRLEKSNMQLFISSQLWIGVNLVTIVPL